MRSVFTFKCLPALRELGRHYEFVSVWKQTKNSNFLSQNVPNVAVIKMLIINISHDYMNVKGVVNNDEPSELSPDSVVSLER